MIPIRDTFDLWSTYLPVLLGFPRMAICVKVAHFWGPGFVHLPRFWPREYGGTGRPREQVYNPPVQIFTWKFAHQIIHLHPPREWRERV